MSIPQLLARDEVLTTDQVDTARRQYVEHFANTIPNISLTDFAIKLLDERKRGTARKAANKRWKGYIDDLNSSAQLQYCLTDIIESRCALLVGAGFSMDQTGRDPNRSSLKTSQIIDQMIRGILAGPPKDKNSITELELRNLPLPVLATVWQQFVPNVSIKVVIDQFCRELPRSPALHHERLARLNCFDYIITTNWDKLLENTFTKLHGDSSKFNLVYDDSCLDSIDPSYPTIIKLHGHFELKPDGTLDWKAPPRVSQQAIQTLRFDNPKLFGLLQSVFLKYRIVVAGFDPRDHNFQHLISDLNFSKILMNSNSSLVGTAGAAQDSTSRPPIIVNTDKLAKFYLAHQPEPVALNYTASEFLSHAQAWERSCCGTSGSKCRKGRGSRLRKQVTSHALEWTNEHGRTDRHKIGHLADVLLDCFPQLVQVDISDTGNPDHDNPEAGRQLVARRLSYLLESWIVDAQHFAVGPGATIAKACAYLANRPVDYKRSIFSPAQISYFHSSPVQDGLGCISQLLRSPYGQPEVRTMPPEINVDTDGFNTLAKVSDRSSIEALGNWLKHAELSSGNDPLPSYVLSVSDLDEPADSFMTWCRQVMFLSAKEIGHVNCLKSAEEVAQEVKRSFAALRTKGYVGEMLFSLVRERDPDRCDPLDISEAFPSQKLLARCLLENNFDNKYELRYNFLSYLAASGVRSSTDALREATKSDSRACVVAASGKRKARTLLKVLSMGIGDTLLIDIPLAERLIKERRRD